MQCIFLLKIKKIKLNFEKEKKFIFMVWKFSSLNPPEADKSARNMADKGLISLRLINKPQAY
jgi:hypothetical protein